MRFGFLWLGGKMVELRQIELKELVKFEIEEYFV